MPSPSRLIANLLLVCVLSAGWRAAAAAAGPDQIPDPSPAAVGGLDPKTAIEAALADELFDLARTLLERHLQTVAPHGADAAAAWALWARALHELGQDAEILKRFEQADHPADNGNGETLFWRALAHHHLGRHAQALELADQFQQRFPDSPRAADILRLRAAALTATGAIPEALAVFAAFAEAHPDSPQATANHLDWAKVLIAHGETNAAVAKLTILAADLATGTGREAAYWLGRQHLQQERWSEAAAIFRSLLAAPGTGRIEAGQFGLALAETLQRQDDLEAALAALTEAIPLLAPGDRRRQARIDAARLMFQTGRTDEAGTWLREIIRAAPQRSDVPELQLGLANGLLRGGRHERAAAEFQIYLDAFTNRIGQAEALSGLGWSLLGLERSAEAAETFEKAAQRFDDPARRTEALFKAADAWFLNLRYTAALDAYRQAAAAAALTADTERITAARYQAAETLIHLERFDEAISALRDLADTFPGFPYAIQARLRIAKLHEQRGALIEAMDEYKAIIAITTEDSVLADSLLSSGMLSYQLFRFDDALATFDRLLKRLPDHPLAERARFMTVWSYSMAGQEAEAIAAARRFLESHPESSRVPEIMFRIAESDFNQDRVAEAEERFLLLVERHPQSAIADRALLWAGRAAARRRNFRQAIEAFTRLARDYPDSPRLAEARFSQADAFSELGEFAEAIILFDEVISHFPESYLHPAAIGRKGDCQFMLGTTDRQRYADAMESYRLLLDKPGAPADMQLQALYKIGRCHEQLDARDEALEYYHAAVVRYREIQRQGNRPTPAAVWGLQRAAFDAATILESRQQWRQAVRILQRVVDAGVPATAQAAERIDRIRSEHWLLFY